MYTLTYMYGFSLFVKSFLKLVYFSSMAGKSLTDNELISVLEHLPSEVSDLSEYDGECSED